MKQFIQMSRVINIEAVSPGENPDFPDGMINIFTDDEQFVQAHYSEELLDAISSSIVNESKWLMFEDFDEDEDGELMLPAESPSWVARLVTLIENGVSPDDALAQIDS